MSRIWAGLDAGKTHHHCVVIDAEGTKMLSRRVSNHGQELLYIPGRTVNRAAGAYRGEGKTDARDAAIIADQARMRRDRARRSCTATSSTMRTRG